MDSAPVAPSSIPTGVARKLFAPVEVVIDLVLLIIRPKYVRASSPTAAWIRRHPTVSLLVLAYVLTWVGLVPQIAAQNRWISISDPVVANIVAMFAVCGCIFAAVIVAGAVGGPAGRRALLMRYLHWRLGVQWYLVALLGPAAFMLAGVGLAAVIEGKSPVIPGLSISPTMLISSLVVLLVQYFIFNTEEICWRGSALPRLQARYSSLVATLIIGVFETLWHLPYLLAPASLPKAMGLPAFGVFTLALAILFTWVYNSTGGSILIVGLFHAAFNAEQVFVLNPQDILPMYLVTAVLCMLAVVAVLVFGARRLSRKPESEIPIEPTPTAA